MTREDSQGLSVGPSTEDQVLSPRHFYLKTLGEKELIAKRPESRASEEGRKPEVRGILETQERNCLEDCMSKM